MEGWNDGWKDGRMEGWMDGWMDGWTTLDKINQNPASDDTA